VIGAGADFDAVLFDVDGTLTHGDRPIPGAVDAVRAIAGRDMRVRYLTNTTRFSRGILTAMLRGYGFPVDEGALFTAPVAAVAWLRRNGVRRISLFVADATLDDFAGFDRDADRPEAVVIGDLGAGWDFATLNHAFRPLLEGARLVALQKNRFWRTAEGLVLDAGAFVAALEFAAGVEAVVTGKPGAEFFLAAAASTGVPPERILVVGDDAETDLAGAANAGMRGVLVRTGKFREDVLARSAVAPLAVLDSAADLAAVL
jgi:phospholysine phosphohistidine inorganic pyrophosphate phosphatase